MIPRRIHGASHWLGAPAGWEPDKDGDCGHLAIRTNGDPLKGAGWCESAWEPTPEEIKTIKGGGSIILRVWGWQPPVALYVEHLETIGPVAVEPPEIQGAQVPDALTLTTEATDLVMRLSRTKSEKPRRMADRVVGMAYFIDQEIKKGSEILVKRADGTMTRLLDI